MQIYKKIFTEATDIFSSSIHNSAHHLMISTLTKFLEEFIKKLADIGKFYYLCILF